MKDTTVAIQDAEPAPWQAAKKPDPSPSEHAVGRAALAFAAADRAVRKHEGARQGREYDRKIRCWREAYSALLAAAATYEGETTDVAA